MIVFKNKMGWSLKKMFGSYGYIFRHSGSFWGTLLSTCPFWLNLIWAAISFLAGARFLEVLFALPITFILSFCVFRNAKLYINLKRNIIMDESFLDRFSIRDFAYRQTSFKGLYQLYVINKSKSNEYLVWESDSIEEVKQIENVLQNISEHKKPNLIFP